MNDEATEAFLDGFVRWMEAERYAASTVAQSRRDAARIIGDCLRKEQPPARLHSTALRFVRFLDALEEPGLAKALGAPLRWLCSDEAATQHRRERGRGRKLDARSVDDDNWVTLYHAVRARDTIAARVLEVQMVAGLRVGDVLRIERAAIADGLTRHVLTFPQKGGRDRTYHLGDGPLREAFRRLFDRLARCKGDARTVQDHLGTNYAAAYKRVQRELDRVARAIELPGRSNTHRLRRTVAVQALRTTRDLHAVAQLLGHRSIQSTMRYVDEERPDDVADLADQLHSRFLPDAPT